MGVNWKFCTPFLCNVLLNVASEVPLVVFNKTLLGEFWTRSLSNDMCIGLVPGSLLKWPYI